MTINDDRPNVSLKAKFHYAILLANLVADLQLAGIWPITRSLLAAR